MFGSGHSARSDARDAAAEACAHAAAGLNGRTPDLCVVFFSYHHAERAGELIDELGARLGPRRILGCSADGAIGATADLEGRPGIAVLAGHLPGTRLVGFNADDLLSDDPARSSDDELASRAAEAIGGADDLRGVLLLADPFSTPTVRVLPALNAARHRPGEDTPAGAVLGGMASGGMKAGTNALVLDGSVRRLGAVGVAIHGPVRIDAVVSQGCRPIGPTMVVTRARHNIIFELGGRPALAAVRAAVADLSESDRKLLPGGLQMGLVVDEYKPRFGRGDFLVRAIVGADEQHDAIAVADMVRVGQTVQLQLRDQRTAREDLSLLLDGQRLHGRPAGVVLCTCNGRGERFYGSRAQDLVLVQRAFREEDPAEQRAKPGEELGPSERAVPLAGFFAAGEIGPVGTRSWVHGQTACLAVFRDPEA
jgi:small ligand-binding sensory domain FIST